MPCKTTYYLCIDESGDFGEALVATPRQQVRASLISGLCSAHGHGVWETRRLACVSAFDETRKVRFHHPEDFHCGPLVKREGKTRSATVPQELRLEFTGTVFQGVVPPAKGTLFGFASRNDARVFAYSRQATYGLNLLAALHRALDELARRKDGDPGFKVDELHVVIARHTSGETQPNTDQPSLLGDNQPLLRRSHRTPDQASIFRDGLRCAARAAFGRRGQRAARA